MSSLARTCGEIHHNAPQCLSNIAAPDPVHLTTTIRPDRGRCAGGIARCVDDVQHAVALLSCRLDLKSSPALQTLPHGLYPRDEVQMSLSVQNPTALDVSTTPPHRPSYHVSFLHQHTISMSRRPRPKCTGQRHPTIRSGTRFRPRSSNPQWRDQFKPLCFHHLAHKRRSPTYLSSPNSSRHPIHSIFTVTPYFSRHTSHLQTVYTTRVTPIPYPTLSSTSHYPITCSPPTELTINAALCCVLKTRDPPACSRVRRDQVVIIHRDPHPHHSPTIP